MKKFNYINQEEYDNAVAEVEAGFKFENGVRGNVYSSHTDALITQLTQQIMEEKQISKDAAETYLQTSGLTIYSTQVSSVQNIMEEGGVLTERVPFEEMVDNSFAEKAVKNK